MGTSPLHSSSVPLVVNLSTGAITPQFHVVFDDWFGSVAVSHDDLPDFNSDAWTNMFGDSSFQFLPHDDDDKPSPDTACLPPVDKHFLTMSQPPPLQLHCPLLNCPLLN